MFSQVEQELQGLEALEYQMSRNLESLRERYEGAKFSRTLRGKVCNAFGKLIATYCIIRIISVSPPITLLSRHNEVGTSQYAMSSSCLSTAHPRLGLTLISSRNCSFFYQRICGQGNTCPLRLSMRRLPLSRAK